MRPERHEAAEYYFKYIDRVAGDDPVAVLETQSRELPALLLQISEEQSLARYAPDKWSIRTMWSHVNDAERVFLSRAFWFARGLEGELPSMDQDICAAAARGDEIPWARHVQEFRHLRLSTLDCLRNLSAEAWTRSGIASGNPITVRALAFILAGHVEHHRAVLRERYGVVV